MIQRFLLFAGLLALPACSGGESPAGAASPEAFFDLKGYIQEEARRLSEQQPPVVKRIAINGEEEEKTFDSLDYHKELDIFARSDINKTAWLDKYHVESSFQHGRLIRLTYTCEDKKLKTRLLEVQFADGKVSRIHVKNRTNSIVADVGQEMWYSPEKGYRLESSQATALTEEKKVKVEVEFVK